MKKNLFLALLLGFLLCGCFGEKAKCDNKKGLEILESLIKNGISKGYDYQFGEHYEEEDEEIMKNINLIRKAQNDFKQYLDKDVRIEFGSFRTQGKDKLSCRCIAKVKIMFPEPPDSVKAVQELYAKDSYWEGNQFINNSLLDLSFLSQGLQTTFNDMQEVDNVIYDITLTNDKKQVYAKFINIDMRYLK